MGVISTQNITYRLIANEQQLDVFEDEDLKISNNVTGLFDIGVLPSDFTRQITLPGTKVNNAFFEHVYDISIENPFLFATNVNTYLTDLTSLSKYNHTSSYNNITASWTGSLFGGDIVYPLADYGSGYQFTQGQYELFGMDDVNGALSVQNFKPAIRVKAVLDAIFEGAGYTYSSSFMNQDWVQNVYMIANYGLKYPEYAGIDLETYGKIKVAAISGSGMTDLNLASGSWVTLPWYNKISDPQNFYNGGAYTVDKRTRLSGVLNLNLNVSCSVNNMPGTLSANGTFQIRMLETGSSTPYSTQALQSYIFFFDQLQASRGNNGINQNFELATQFLMDDIPTGSYYFQIRQSPNQPSPTELPKVTVDPNGTTRSYLEIKEVKQAADGRVLDIPSNMPFATQGIKQIDFIIALQRKFHLVIYPDKTKPNNFIIETFNNWYNKGRVASFDNYIDLNQKWDVTPANNLAVNKLNFGDTLDQDYLSQQFSKAANREYGKSYYTDLQNFYSQGTLEVKTTLASTPLVKIAGTGLSGSVSGINPSPTHFSIGTYKVSYVNSASLVCGNFTEAAFYQLYTNDGTFATGKIAYTDQYGNNPVIGFDWMVFNTGGGGNEIYSLNPSTGEIGYGTGFFC